jgi:hypothetical protein
VRRALTASNGAVTAAHGKPSLVSKFGTTDGPAS